MPSSFLMYINLTKKQISNQVEDIVLILSNAAIYNLLSMYLLWSGQNSNLIKTRLRHILAC